MNTEYWQSLLNLESRDIVSEWFETIHARKLNARRAKEIIASARQGREYFRSAGSASFAVRPLLAFYGVASLCRALTLLHRRDAGEEGLKQGHGLETVNWSATLSSDLPTALASIGKLRVRTCGGLFSDLIGATGKEKVFPIYDRVVRVSSGAEDKYLGNEVSFLDILERLPDIHSVASMERPRKWVRLKDFTYSSSVATIAVHGGADHPVCAEYASYGFKTKTEKNPFDDDEEITFLEIDSDALRRQPPQIFDTRIIRTNGGHPSPHLVSRFGQDMWFSQIAVTYITSFILGMLARYYPTHWSALMGGEKGDGIWPNINVAQAYIEAALPELVLDVIGNSIYGIDEPGKEA